MRRHKRDNKAASVPPDEYKQRIAEFRNRWTSNGLREVVEPHITIKAQSGLTADLVWLNKVKDACSSFPSFHVSLAEPSSYDTAVTFLTVESNDIFDLHKRLMDAVSPSQESIIAYELDGFHPHLTLGQTRWGMEASEVKEIEEEETALAPFPTFDVTYVRVYNKSNQTSTFRLKISHLAKNESKFSRYVPRVFFGDNRDSHRRSLTTLKI